MYDESSELCRYLLAKFLKNNMNFRCYKKNRSKYDPGNLFLKTFNYDMWFENEESTVTTRKGDNKRSEKYNQ